MVGPLLLLLPCVAAWQLSLLHVNDMHARMEETNKHSSPCAHKDQEANKCYGGVARVATAVAQMKAEDKGSDAVLWINGGDFFQGTMWYTRFRWSMVAQMNAMLDFDAMTLGNHEFDDGEDGLIPFLKNLTCPLVVSNMAGDCPKLKGLYKASHVVEKGGRKIGFVGYLTPDTLITANVPACLVLDDEVEALTKEVASLKAKGVDIIIALGHAGYLMDQKVAREVPGIDIIVGAHSHSFLFTENGTSTNPNSNRIEGDYPTEVTSSEGDTVLIVQAFAFTKYLGHIKVNFSDAGRVESYHGAPILLDHTWAKDPAVVAALAPGKEELDKSRLEVIGETEVLLYTSRQVETTLGNLITDAMVWAYRDKRDEHDRKFLMAVHHSGGIRVNLTAGNVTLGGIMNVLPFEHSFDTLSLKGEFIRAAFEHSASDWQAKNGRFLQMSGIQVTYNMNADVGSRVCGVCVVREDGLYEVLDDTASYSMVVAKYPANGGDGFSSFADNKEEYQIGDMDTDVVQKYLAEHSPVHPLVERRITVERTCSRDQAPCLPASLETSGAGRKQFTCLLLIVMFLL